MRDSLCTVQLFRESPVAMAVDSHFDVPNQCGNVIVAYSNRRWVDSSDD